MGEFTSDHYQSLIIKPQFPFLDQVFEPNMEDITQFSGITQTSTTTNNNNNNNNHNNALDNSILLNFQNFLPFSSDNFFSNNPNHHPHHELGPPNMAQNFHGNNLISSTTNHLYATTSNNYSSVSQKPIINNIGTIQAALAENNNNIDHSHESKKRKSLNFDASESSSGISSPPVSENGIKKKIGSGKGKRVKGNKEKEEEKPKEVVHVRARRGQATDSHSLAERVRRGKINERLRCLQDIVPGCYKTMGMAVMLDEIINYVQSLQNQVEFLSMKLTAASTFYDFNSETDAVERLQRAKANEAKEMERLIKEGYGGFACFHSTWPL